MVDLPEHISVDFSVAFKPGFTYCGLSDPAVEISCGPSPYNVMRADCRGNRMRPVISGVVHRLRKKELLDEKSSSPF